jgi:hypothetical protein
MTIVQAEADPAGQEMTEGIAALACFLAQHSTLLGAPMQVAVGLTPELVAEFVDGMEAIEFKPYDDFGWLFRRFGPVVVQMWTRGDLVGHVTPTTIFEHPYTPAEIAARAAGGGS